MCFILETPGKNEPQHKPACKSYHHFSLPAQAMDQNFPFPLEELPLLSQGNSGNFSEAEGTGMPHLRLSHLQDTQWGLWETEV